MQIAGPSTPKNLGNGEVYPKSTCFLTEEVIKALVSHGVLFTLTAHDGTTGWKDQLSKEGLVWTPWIYTEEEKQKAIARERELPEMELSRFYWTPSWSVKGEAKLMFPVIVKRTLNSRNSAVNKVN